MFKVGVVIVGPLIVGFGLLGMYNAYDRIDNPPVSKSDLEANAIITNIHADQAVHRLTNVVISTTYKIQLAAKPSVGKK